MSLLGMISNQILAATAILQMPQLFPYLIQAKPFMPQFCPQLFLIFQPNPCFHPTSITA